MKKFLLLTICSLFGFLPIMAQNGLAADGWYEYTVSGGNLSELISEDLKYQITKLRLKGKINCADVKLIRDMAGLPYEFNVTNDNFTDGRLEYLDLTDAEIIYGGGFYGVFNKWTGSHTDNAIGNYTFQYSKTLVDVKIGDSVTKIGAAAFANCPNLKSVSISGTVQTSGSSAFANCTSLTSVVIPKLTKLSGSTFRDCTSLVTVNFPQLPELSTWDFYGCTSLISVSIPEITEIPRETFRGCTSLETIEFPKVTKTGESAFYGCLSLKKVSLPQAKIISNNSFANCSSLSELLMPELQQIGSFVQSSNSHAFYNCTSLTSLSFEKLEKIDRFSFEGCTALTSVTLPALTEVSASCFYKCSALEKVSAPNVKTIGNGAFGYCTSLKEIPLPFVEKIDADAFQYCTSLQSLSIPLATSIGNSAFWGCNSLKSVSADNAKEIKHYAFQNCESLEEISFASVERIDDQTFYNCKSLSDVSFPNLIEIGKSSLSGCESLVNISLPNVLSVGYNAFYATSLKKVFLPKATQIAERAFYYCKLLNIVELPEAKTIGKYSFLGCSSLSYANLSKVDSIGEQAFTNCRALENVHMPSVRFIDKKAFNDCSLLNSFDMSEVLFVGDEAFRGCEKIRSVSMPKIDSVGNYAFEKCRLNQIIIPKVHGIGTSAFLNSPAEIVEIGENIKFIGANALDKSEIVRISCKDVPKLNGTNLVGTGTVIVPAEAFENYCQADNWIGFNLRIIPDNVQTDITATVEAQEATSGLLKVVGDEALNYITSLTLKGSINSYDFMLMRNKMPNLHYLDLTETTVKANPYQFITGCYTEDNRFPNSAFQSVNKLYAIKLPNSIKLVGKKAFSNCIQLKTVTVYNGVQRIDESAFGGCPSLANVDLPDGIVSIGKHAFRETALESITLGDGLLSLEQYAFLGCDELKKVILPSSLEFIEDGCFFNCKSLVDIELPLNLYSIGTSLFYGCKSLRKVNLPARIVGIGETAFKDCSSLEEIRIAPMVETIGGNAFEGCEKLKDVYVYIANAKDISIAQNTFPNSWTVANLHVPDFAYDSYYWDTQWSQFAHLDEFNDKYETFYSKNTITLDKGTGTITGTPDATLHENGGLIVNDEEKQELDEIQLKSDGTNGATLIPENTGNIKAKKVDITIKVKGNKWHFFCFPFDVPLSGMKYEGEYVWRRYDGAKRSRREGGWQNLAAGTTTLEAGRGYIFQGTADGELTLSVENPEITASDVKTGLEVYPSDNSQDASWNFVGNPYVSYYSIDATTYSSPITIWNGTGYEAYRPGDDDYMFHPYQAFFVQTPVDASEIGFDATARESYEQSQTTLAAAKVRRAARKMNVNRLLANLELFAAGDTTYMDKTRIVFNDKENMEYDAVSDAAKFMSSERAAEFYTLDSKNVQYAINERPMASGDVRMGFIANKAGEYRIAQSRSDVEMLLVDHQEGITHNLGTGAYAFSSGEGTFENRFTLKVHGQETGITELKEKTGIDLTVDGELCINGAADEVETSVYQLNGVLAGAIQGNGNLRLPKGIYAVKVGLLTLKVQI